MKEFWELLNLTEDKIKHGYREEHEVPEFKEVKGECRDCSLYLTRNRVVYGVGSDKPKLMIVGTWPNSDDEISGEPISGKAKDFLYKWIGAMKLSPMGECYITNLLKCKTGWNKRANFGTRDHKEEIHTCFSHLEEEIKRLQPKIILTLGEIPSQMLSGNSNELEGNRGHIHRFMGIPVVSTYHPETALENYEALRAPVWDDLKLAIRELNN